MKRVSLFVFLLLCASLLTAQESVFNGHVKWCNDSTPAAGVDVLVFLPDSTAFAALTDSSGNFTFDSIPTASLRFDLYFHAEPLGVGNTELKIEPLSVPEQWHWKFCIVHRSVAQDSAIHTERYGSGRIFKQGPMKSERREGEWLCFYENGMLWSRGTFVDGKRQGYGVSYWRNGKKSSEGFYKDDKMTGAWKFWDENGTLVEKDMGE